MTPEEIMLCFACVLNFSFNLTLRGTYFLRDGSTYLAANGGTSLHLSIFISLQKLSSSTTYRVFHPLLYGCCHLGITWRGRHKVASTRCFTLPSRPWRRRCIRVCRRVSPWIFVLLCNVSSDTCRYYLITCHPYVHHFYTWFYKTFWLFALSAYRRRVEG